MCLAGVTPARLLTFVGIHQQAPTVSAGGTLAMAARTCPRGKTNMGTAPHVETAHSRDKSLFQVVVVMYPTAYKRRRLIHSAVESITPRALHRVLHFVGQNGGVILDPLID